jgi:hypothetical protein
MVFASFPQFISSLTTFQMASECQDGDWDCICKDKNDPRYSIEECEKCIPAEFIKWWQSLSVAGGVYNTDWYKYEQRVARNNGQYGTRPRHTGYIDADGIEPSSCCLVDAKYVGSPDSIIYQQPNWADKGFSELVGILEGYRRTIEHDYGWRGAQPKGLIVKVSHPNAISYYQSAVNSAKLGNLATVIPVP